MNDLDTITSKYVRYHQALTKFNEDNKGVVFDVLAAANITKVLVEFDGGGDSGQINSVAGFRDKETVALPAVNVTLQRLSWGDTEPAIAESPLQEAIETLCYDYLEVTHDGWENNDGAYGEFYLDVVKRTVDLVFIGRFTDTYTTYDTF